MARQFASSQPPCHGTGTGDAQRARLGVSQVIRQGEHMTEAKGRPRGVSAPEPMSDILLQRYLLRGLLWCQLCDLPIVPILLRPLSRYYACTNKECPRPAMPAKLTEHRVWSRLIRLDATMVHGVPRERRHAELRRVLSRVSVREGITDLRFEWGE
jgi:hypothetical protein